MYILKHIDIIGDDEDEISVLCVSNDIEKLKQHAVKHFNEYTDPDSDFFDDVEWKELVIGIHGIISDGNWYDGETIYKIEEIEEI